MERKNEAARAVVTGGKARDYQVRAERRDAFSKARRAAFLDHLAATCNVRMSAEAAGVVISTVYKRRRTDPGFAELWSAAIQTGYARLEEMLIERAMGAGSAADGDLPIGETVVPDPRSMDTELALALLRHHRGGLEGRVRAGGGSNRRATQAETDAALLKKLKALSRRLDKTGATGPQ